MNTTPQSMLSRRDILKMLGLGLGAVFLSTGTALPDKLATASHWTKSLARPGMVQFGTQRFRGTTTGEIFSSSDDGQTWTLLTRLGDHLEITDLLADGNQLLARLVYQGQAFWLRSPDGVRWFNYA